jgi:integrase
MATGHAFATSSVEKRLTNGPHVDQLRRRHDASLEGFMPRKKRARGVEALGGGRFRLRFCINDPRKVGTVIDTERTIQAAGMKEALAERARLLAELRAAGLPEKSERMSLRTFSAGWFAARVSDLKHSTKCRYKEQITLLCNGAAATKDGRPEVTGLGDFFLDTLTPVEVRTFLADAAKRFSGYTCLGLLRVLRTITKDAQRELHLEHWPCDGVKRPKAVSAYTLERPNALSAEELRRVLDEFRRNERLWYPMFAVMAFTGLRFAEVAALQHGDIDRATGVLRVVRGVYRGVVGTPKTTRGTRTLVLPREVLDALPPANMASPGAWLFPSAKGKPHGTGALNPPLRRVLSRLRLEGRATVHGLRRSFNSIALGVAHAELVRKALGHSDPAMTMHYLNVDLAALTKLGADVAERVLGTGAKPGFRSDPAPPAPPASPEPNDFPS